MEKAVFFDKDGTIVKNVPYNGDPEKVEFIKGTSEVFTDLKKLGFKLIVVTNQGGVAQGRLSLKEVRRIRSWFKNNLKDLDDFYFCPHFPGGKVRKFSVNCRCRKPKPGLLLRAARRYALDLNKSWLVGDILDDMEAGKRAGCQTILLDVGSETQWKSGRLRKPDFVLKSLEEVPRVISEKARIDFKEVYD
jgi:D,D-heptose 1,7-bisphosphate phosphatase